MGIRRLAAPAGFVSAALAAALTIGIAGCVDAQRSAPDTASATTTVAPQPQTCASVHLGYEPKLADQHVRCVLVINSLTLEVSSDPAWSFTSRDHNAVIQQFREATDEVGQTGVAPLLQDIDRSGTPTLLVVTGRGGTGGEPMAVWRLTGSRDRFVRAGEMFGFRRFYRTAEGFFGNYAHSSAASGTVTLYRWFNDTLDTVAVLDTQAAGAPKDETRTWVRTGDVLCALNEDDDPPGAEARRTEALRAAGLNPATAREQLCGQPWVASIYQGGG
jgi:hypothetical protein